MVEPLLRHCCPQVVLEAVESTEGPVVFVAGVTSISLVKEERLVQGRETGSIALDQR